MNDMIEKLKDKNYVRAFGLLEPEEQECLRKAGYKNCQKYQGKTGLRDFWQREEYFNNTDTYRIKPDYKPEPEPVDCEIHKKAGTLWVEYDGIKYKTFELLSQEEFAGFYHTGGDKQTEVESGWVARYFPNVIARFRS